MSGFATAVRVLIVSLIISCLFYFLHPKVIEQGLISKNLKETLANHRREAVKWSNVKQQVVKVNREIDLSIANQSFTKWGFQYFIKAPFTEELVFRGFFVLIPALLLPAKKSFLKINWVVVLLWITMFIGSSFWALGHNYGYFPQAMIVWGGLINGSCIIHSAHAMPKKALGMLAAIFLHALANSFYIILFYLI